MSIHGRSRLRAVMIVLMEEMRITMVLFDGVERKFKQERQRE